VHRHTDTHARHARTYNPKSKYDTHTHTHTHTYIWIHTHRGVASKQLRAMYGVYNFRGPEVAKRKGRVKYLRVFAT